MNVEFTKKFEKQIDKISDLKLLSEISNSVQNVMNSNELSEIVNLKKLKGYENAYRIRTGNYRIGIVIENDTVTFAAFYHRKDIYKFFP